MKVTVGIGVVFVIGALAFFGVRKAKQKNEMSKQVVVDLINPYFNFIKEGKYEQAYALTGVSYQEEWPYVQFVKTYNNRIDKYGNLLSWECYRLGNESNLFTKEKLLQIYLHLFFENYNINVMIEVDESENNQKIFMSWEDMGTDRLDKTLF